MRLGQLALFSSIVLALAIPAAASSHARRTPSRSFTKRTSLAKRTPKKSVAKAKSFGGQRTIDDDRATQIQQALIKAGYLSGTPSGHWDADSVAAMTKLQADNGWQTKLVPDSRALIKLGLGPGTSPATTAASSATPSAGSGATPGFGSLDLGDTAAFAQSRQ